MLSSSLEKYLVCIYSLQKAEKELKSTEVAKSMNQPLQKTIQALQRMHYQKQIIYSPYQPLKLTKQGQEMAEYLLARDALLEEFLSLLNIESNASGEKEAMTQYLSYESLKKIERFVLLNRQYPEISQRLKMLSRISYDSPLLPPVPENESK